MEEKLKEELKVLLNEALKAVEEGNEEVAKAKIAAADEAIKLPPTGGTGSNGTMPVK